MPDGDNVEAYRSHESLFDILMKVTGDGVAFTEYEAALVLKKLLQTINF